MINNWIYKLLIVIQFILIVVFFSIFIFRKDNSNTYFDNSEIEKELEKSLSKISYWENKSKNWKIKSDSSMKIINSLKSLPPQIKIVYEKVYQRINSSNNQQLDSIIRANW
jgi:hypothetical protein